jgi:phage shock protein C
MNYQPNEPRRFYRSNDAVIFGVCAGIAEHFDLPVLGVRIAWVLLALIPGIGTVPMVLSYIVLGFVLKRRPVEPVVMSSTDPFQGPSRGTHSQLIERIQERFDALDKRLQRMESIVTRPGFGLEEKYRDLK